MFGCVYLFGRVCVCEFVCVSMCDVSMYVCVCVCMCVRE